MRKKRFTDILRKFNRGRCTALMKDGLLALKGQTCKHECSSNELDKVKEKYPGELGMKSLTPCQADGTRMGVRTVRRHPTEHGMKSLTSCQVNGRARVGVRTVRRYPAGPGIKSLTSCQANRTKV